MLHLPTDLAIDPVSVDRLARQLEAAPAEVIGIVAPVVELPPGSSTRVHAEWCSLRPLGDATDAEPADHRVTGALLLRTGLDASVTTEAVTLPAGTVRTDPGAVTHRHGVEPADDLPAGDEGRSPFPWRPVVLFLAAGPDPLPTDRLARVEQLVDELIDVEVEPRLAARGLRAAPRRQRPCAPTAATVAALAPDVIVALDAAALDQGAGWCTRRGTVLIDMTDGSVDEAAAGGVELVSWQIGQHPTRLRARVDPTITAGALARLVNRLAAGPQPTPPVDQSLDQSRDQQGSPVELRGTMPTAPRRAIELVRVSADGDLGPESGELHDGLADRLQRAGHEVGPTGDALLVVERGDDLDRVPDLGPGSRAVAADPQVVERLRARGIRTQLVPVMTPTARQDALRAAGAAPLASSGGVIGWTFLDATSAPVGAIADALADALRALLDDRPSLEVEIVTVDGSVPDVLTGHPQVRVLTGRPDPGEQARWTAHVLTADDDALSPSRLSLPLLEAAHAGVPTLLAPGPSRAVGGLADPRLVVDDPTSAAAWTTPLQLLLDRDDRPARSAWASRTAEALERAEVTDLVVARLFGWLDRDRVGEPT